MIKIIACRDHGFVDRKTDWQQWNHACRAFGADELQMVDDLSDAVVPEWHRVVVMEEAGNVSLQNFRHPIDCVYVFGRSGMANIHNLIKHDHVVRIPTPDDVCLFGITAVGVTLYDRLSKTWL